MVSQESKKVSIINIKVNSISENFAKTFCETLASETSSYYVEIKAKKANTNVNILQFQADSIRKELNIAIKGVATEADYVYNLNPAFNINGTPAKRKQIDVQANTTILTQIIVNLELAKVNLRKETPLIQIIDKPILPLSKQRIGLIKAFLIGSFFALFFTIFFIIVKNIIKS